MKPALRELFRNNLIAQLAAVGAIGMKPASLNVLTKIEGIEATDQQLTDELQYLADKKLVTTIDKTVSPELKRWRITAEGRDYAAAHNLG